MRFDHEHALTMPKSWVYRVKIVVAVPFLFKSMFLKKNHESLHGSVQRSLHAFMKRQEGICRVDGKLCPRL